MSAIMYNLGMFGRIVIGVWYLRNNQAAKRILILQILFTCVEALGITCLLAVGIGAAINIIGIPFLANINQDRMIYTLLIMIITRELGPLLVAFIVIARSATAIATEIAGMVISHEIEAYISVGVDPIEHLAVPRFLGVAISVFLLNIFFSIFGLAGSFLIQQFFTQLPASVYFSYLLQSLTLPDLLISIIKGLVFGMIISTVAITHGFAVGNAPTDVPVAGLKAVGTAFGLCIMVDVILSAVYYLVTLV